MKTEEQESKVTLYTFFYDIKKNEVFGQEDEAKYYKGSFFIHDEDGETIYVHGDKLDVPQPYTTDKEAYIYVYSPTNDVNKAMELMHKVIEDTYTDLNKRAEFYGKMLDTFTEKQAHIKQKYPTGKRDIKVIEEEYDLDLEPIYGKDEERER